MSSAESEDDDCYGPALPPHLQKKGEDDPSSEPEGPSVRVGPGPAASELTIRKNTSVLPSIGPTLPPGFKLPSTEEDDEEESPRPPESGGGEYDDSDDEEVIGPLPPDHPMALSRAQAFASSSSDGPQKPEKKLKREEWMLIPPRNKPVTELGLGPRKFLQRAPAAPTKDSGEPMDEEEEFEKQVKEEMNRKYIDEYDSKMEAMIKKSGEGKRRSESLLEMHQKDLKKKAKKEKEEEKKRKPFDRNTDLAVSGISKEDSKKYVEKSKELGGRFHKGRQKFL